MQNQHNLTDPYTTSISLTLALLSPKRRASALATWYALIAAELPEDDPQPQQDDTAEPEPAEPVEAVEAPQTQDTGPADEDAAEIKAIAAEINETDRKILNALRTRIEPATAKDLANVVCITPRSISNRMMEANPLKKYALVVSEGGYKITERGRKVLVYISRIDS